VGRTGERIQGRARLSCAAERKSCA
jgi:hypothetical protein